MQKITNKYSFASEDRPRWEKTPDGFLRCKARVLASRIMPYARHELEGVPDDFMGDHVNMYVAPDSMACPDAIRSLEGCQITIGDHQWLTPDTVNGFSKGSVAGTPVVDGPYLICDLLVTNEDAIKAIETGELPEISAGYTAEAIYEPGEIDGQTFDARQTSLRFNHIAVIPRGHGRAGEDIRIINKKKGQKDMSETKDPVIAPVRVMLKNTGRYVNTDEEGAKAIADEGKEQEKSLEKTMNELEGKNGELETLQAEIDELKGGLAAYKEKLDELLSEEAVEEKAFEMIAEQEDAEEIIQNADMEEDEDKKKEFMNSIKRLHGAKLHKAVLGKVGIKIENMSDAEIKGAFKAHVQICKITNKKPVVSGTKIMNAVSHTDGSRPALARTPHEMLGFKK